MTTNAVLKDDVAAPQSYPVALIPRINIGVFADNQLTGEIMQAASVDRRMSRAHVTIQLGGILAAAQVYKSQPTPSVLLVETHGGREQVLAELAMLAEVCQPDTKVIVLGHVNDVILYRELMRQGLSEYLVAPFSPLTIIETLGSLYADPKSAPLGRIIAFVGAKGGVGSSTIAHNVGWSLSQKHSIETVITDLDLAFGTASLNFNQDGGGGIFEALSQPDRIDQTLIDRLMTKLGDKLNLLNSISGVERDFIVEAHAVETVLNTVRLSSPMVVVDVPNMWAPWIKYTLLNADEVVITATPELPSLRNAKSMIDLLKQSRQNDRAPRLVLNQIGVPKRPEIPVGEFAKAVGVDPLVTIPYDPQTFGTAQGQGQMLFEVAPKSKSVEALEKITSEFSGASKTIVKPAKAGIGGLFKNFSLRKKK